MRKSFRFWQKILKKEEFYGLWTKYDMKLQKLKKKETLIEIGAPIKVGAPIWPKLYRLLNETQRYREN
jgi:hypothetical protein